MPKQRDGRYLYPHPEFAGVLVSRQRVWQLRRKADGGCVKCGQPVAPQTINFCPAHRLIDAERMRRQYRRKKATHV